jgi:hypothetical protein
MKPRLSIRDLLWLALVVGVAVAWWFDHRAMKRELGDFIEGPFTTTQVQVGCYVMIALLLTVAVSLTVYWIKAGSPVRHDNMSPRTARIVLLMTGPGMLAIAYFWWQREDWLNAAFNLVGSIFMFGLTVWDFWKGRSTRSA